MFEFPPPPRTFIVVWFCFSDVVVTVAVVVLRVLVPNTERTGDSGYLFDDDEDDDDDDEAETAMAEITSKTNVRRRLEDTMIQLYCVVVEKRLDRMVNTQRMNKE